LKIPFRVLYGAPVGSFNLKRPSGHKGKLNTMKTNFLKTALLAASFFGVVATASAETIHANIPFAFTANGTPMPAGAYTIRSMSSTPNILVFENDATKAKAIAFARTAYESTDATVGFVLKTAASTYELSMAPASSVKGALLAITK